MDNELLRTVKILNVSGFGDWRKLAFAKKKKNYYKNKILIISNLQKFASGLLRRFSCNELPNRCCFSPGYVIIYFLQGNSPIQTNTAIKTRELDYVGESESGMTWENSIEAYILPYVK